MTAAALPRTLPLPGGVQIPVLALGVYEARAGRETVDAVLHAFSVGYRHVDTASLYGNEKEVGEAVRASGLPRGELFVTTKLWNADHGTERALRAFEESRKRLGLEQVDLYLIHWPAPPRLDSWKALVRLKADGRCRAIGVSNYTLRHLDELAQAGLEQPAVNQVELSPFLRQPELVNACRERGIVVEAYSPLTRGEKLVHPVIVSLARRRERTPAQILLRWALERGLVVLPKSVHPERIAENAALFDFALSPEDHVALDGLDEGFRTCWDPNALP